MRISVIFSVFYLLLIASTACDGESSSNVSSKNSESSRNVSSETSRTQEVKVENGQVTINKNGVTTTCSGVSVTSINVNTDEELTCEKLSSQTNGK